MRSRRDVRSWQCRGALLVALVLLCAGCDWTQFGYGPAHTNYNPTETKIGVGNVASLQLAWTGGFGDQPFYSSPAVANGVVYTADNRSLYAFSANGSTACSGTPKTCTPLWTAIPGTTFSSSPAVVNGVVYIGSGDLLAYDATGSTGCSGTPKLCDPLWTAPTGLGGISSPPTVVNGVVYAGSQDGKLYAFDAAGSTGCSGSRRRVPRSGRPRPATVLYDSSPTVVDGVVYVGSFDHKLYAFDAAGSTGCSGIPKTCVPLWTALTGGPISGTAAVANGVVYVAPYDADKMYAFDAAGSTGCSGVPKTCAPLWTAAVLGSGGSSPAVANGIVYIGSDADGQGPGLSAFDAAGSTGCSGVPKTCAPLWTTPGRSGIRSAPSVANGVVYVGDEDTRLYAFDAAGSTGCSGVPKVCGSLWSFTTPHGSIGSSPAVANGFVYVGSGNAYFYAFHL